MSVLFHGQNKSIMSWDQNHLLMLKLYSAWQRMTEKQRGQCILAYHALAVLYSLKIIQERDGGGADKLFQNAIFDKNVKAVFGRDLLPLK